MKDQLRVSKNSAGVNPGKHNLVQKISGQEAAGKEAARKENHPGKQTPGNVAAGKGHHPGKQSTTEANLELKTSPVAKKTAAGTPNCPGQLVHARTAIMDNNTPVRLKKAVKEEPIDDGDYKKADVNQ